MTHDLVIRGGTIVDGSGAEPVSGDIAVDGDTIVAVGEISGTGREEIDAEGHIVTPGFVDIHTHLDAQIGWDPMLTPISWHGVTTALMGNCGVTFAPCKADDRELLAGMMEAVEDIPREAILSGLPWDWESYGDYLDSIERMDPAINVAGLIGHCALRFYVMVSARWRSRRRRMSAGRWRRSRATRSRTGRSASPPPGCCSTPCPTAAMCRAPMPIIRSWSTSPRPSGRKAD